MYLKHLVLYRNCINYYDLNSCWYYRAPGLIWNAMLKLTDIKLQTINSYDMFILKKGLEGGWLIV